MIGQFQVLEKLLSLSLDGCGEGFIIAFEEGKISFEKAVFLLTLNTDAKVHQLRRERKAAKQGTIFSKRRVKHSPTTNIFGRIVRDRRGVLATVVRYSK